MMSAPKGFTGVVHGKTIELDLDTGLPEGQVVTVVLKPMLPVGEGIRQSAGGWADAEADELKEWLDEMQRSRQLEREG